MLQHLINNEKLRFLAVGGFNTLFLYVLYFIFYSWLGESYYMVAFIVAYFFALISGFTLQRLLVFKAKGHLFLDFFRYTLVQLGSFGTNAVLLPLFVEIIGMNPLVAQAIILIITVVGSYFAHRYFSFRRKHSQEIGI